MTNGKQRDLFPLFVIIKGGETFQALPKIMVGEKEYKASNFIMKMVEAYKKDPLELYTDGLGVMTLSAYILAEILHKNGMAEKADEIFSSVEKLSEAAWYTAIGFEVGRNVPDEVEIGTETEENCSNIRKSSKLPSS